MAGSSWSSAFWDLESADLRVKMWVRCWQLDERRLKLKSQDIYHCLWVRKEGRWECFRVFQYLVRCKIHRTGRNVIPFFDSTLSNTRVMFHYAASLTMLVDFYFKNYSSERKNINTVHDCLAVTANNVDSLMELLKLVYIKLLERKSRSTLRP